MRFKKLQSEAPVVCPAWLFFWLSCNPKRIETRLSIRHLAMGNACLHFDEDEEEVTQAGQLEQTCLFWIDLGWFGYTTLYMLVMLV